MAGTSRSSSSGCGGHSSNIHRSSLRSSFSSLAFSSTDNIIRPQYLSKLLLLHSSTSSPSTGDTYIFEKQPVSVRKLAAPSHVVPVFSLWTVFFILFSSFYFSLPPCFCPCGVTWLLQLPQFNKWVPGEHIRALSCGSTWNVLLSLISSFRFVLCNNYKKAPLLRCGFLERGQQGVTVQFISAASWTVECESRWPWLAGTLTHFFSCDHKL